VTALDFNSNKYTKPTLAFSLGIDAAYVTFTFHVVFMTNDLAEKMDGWTDRMHDSFGIFFREMAEWQMDFEKRMRMDFLLIP
jgi:hypothetical protein